MLKEEEMIQIGDDKSKARQFRFYYDVWNWAQDMIFDVTLKEEHEGCDNE